MALDAQWVDKMLDGVGDEPAQQSFDSTGVADQIRQIVRQQDQVGRSGVRRQVNAMLEHMGEHIVGESSFEEYTQHRMAFASVVSDIRTHVPLSPEVSDYVVRFDHDKLMSRHFGVEVAQHFARNPRYVQDDPLPDQRQVATQFATRYHQEADALAAQPPTLYTAGRTEALSTMAQHTGQLADSPLPQGFVVDRAIRDVARQRVKALEQRVHEGVGGATGRSDQQISHQARTLQYQQGVVQGYYDALQIASTAIPGRVHSLDQADGMSRGRDEVSAASLPSSVDFSKGFQQKSSQTTLGHHHPKPRKIPVKETRLEQSEVSVDTPEQSVQRQQSGDIGPGEQLILPVFGPSDGSHDQPDRELN